MYRHKRFSYLIGSLAIAVLAVVALLVLMGGSQTRAAPPSRHLAHIGITADTVWGPGVVTVTEDVVIKNGATLVITPGTTGRIFTDTAPYLGGVSDTKIEIIVEDGRLVADGFITDTQIITPFQTITFTSAFSDGKHPWWGIRILDRDAGESVINYALVEVGTWGIYVDGATPTIHDNTIYNISGGSGGGGIHAATVLNIDFHCVRKPYRNVLSVRTIGLLLTPRNPVIVPGVASVLGIG